MSLSSLASAHLRIARPTDRLEEVVAFYREVLGFHELGRFVDHDGFDGVMMGHASTAYHLEFTHAAKHPAGDAPSAEHLLVFYLPDETQWQAAVAEIEARGATPVPALNPYWDQQGRTYQDPDRYRIVIQNAAWSNLGNQ